MSFSKLKRRQLLERANSVRASTYIPMPQKGWIYFFRAVLSLSTYKLAEKLNISQARVSLAEKAEINKSITLKNLEKMADAMNCDLYYCFIPREDVENFLHKRASEKAKEIIENTSHSMRLENQEISLKEKGEMYRELLDELLNNPKKIW